ncbi:MAG: flippase [Agathobacter sp.]|uniref:flippase n=1 Tax=Agathobacter sp. TaxID=2021311 RepID=UPI00257BE657|nr:flippase [Agathobacter sp.]MBQ1681717.1 flippase [Agathobacter sp.]
MQKTTNLKRNYIYNVSYQILAVLTPLITTPYLSRVLGAERIGDYSYTQSVVAIFALFAALGTLIYGNREISYVQNDRKAYSQTFWEIEFLSVFSVIAVLVVYGIFTAFQTRYFMLYLIQAITFVSAASNIVWFFQGLEEIRRVVIRNIIFRILNVAFTLIFVRKPSDLYLYVLGMVGIECLGNWSIWVYLPKYVDRPDWKNLHPLRHLPGTLLLFVPTIATSIYTIFDKTMIGLFTDTKAENGYYEQSMKLSKTALTLVTALEAVMIPRVGALYANHKEEEMKELLYRVYRFVWLLSLPLAFGLFGVADHFVPVFYGPGYDKVAILLKILCFLIPLIGLSNVTGIQYFMTTKREWYVTRTVCIGAVVNLLLNLALIPYAFSLGAAIASVIAECAITSAQLYLARKELSVKRILTCGWKYIIAACVMFVVLLAEGGFLAPGAFGSAILIATGVVVYGLMLLLLHDELLLGGIRSIRGICARMVSR